MSFLHIAEFAEKVTIEPMFALLREFGWVLRTRRSNNYVLVIFGSELEATRCGYGESRNVGLNFMRGYSSRYLEELYRLRSFQSLSPYFNFLFGTVLTFMDMKDVLEGGPSFLGLKGNVSISVTGKNVHFSYLWSIGPLLLN